MESADQQSGSDQQHERERDFHDHQAAAKPLAGAARAGARSAFLQRFLQVRPRRRQGRRQSKDQSREQRHARGKGEHSAIQPDLIQARDGLRRERDQYLDAPNRQHQPASPGRARQQQALGEHLPDHAPPARTERGANGHFSLTRRSADEQKIGHVGA
jgi:hypothetical protein